MANFHGHQIPQAGQNLMAKLFATGQPLVYTSVKVGDGVLNGRLVSGLTGLIGLKKSFPIAATPVRSGDGRWNVTAIFNNKDIDQDFWWREWGVFAEDPDTGQEVMVAYANAGDTADYIHVWTGDDDSSYVEEQITCTCVVSSELTVTALIDPSQLYVLLEVFQAHRQEFAAHRDDNSNPHGVTAGQIGAAAAGHTHTAAQVGALPASTTFVPPTRKVAGKALAADVALGPGDVGAAAAKHTHTPAEVGAAAANHTHTAAQVGAQPTVTGGATTIVGSNLTANRALVSNASGKVAVSAVTATELGYLDGVTSGIQAQLNGKAASGHTHTPAQAGAAAASHTHAAGQVTAGTLTAGVVASFGTDYGTTRLRNIRASTADLTPGVSALNNGEIYLVYE